MVHTFVDSALKDLSTLIGYRPLADSMKIQIQAFQVDLRLLQMFLRCLITLDPDDDIDRNLISCMLSSIEGIWDNSGEGLYTAGLQAMKKKLQRWNMLASKLGGNIQQCKQQIKIYCVQFMTSSFQCKPFPSVQMLEFLDEILNNLNNLPGENQFETLKEKLLALRHLVDFAARRCPDGKDLTDFLIHAHTWANKAACLTCLYWAGEVEVEDEEIEKRMNLWLTDLLREANPCTHEFRQMCFAAMKSSPSSRADTFLNSEFVLSFAGFLLETMPVALKDDIESLHEGWIFLISYLTDPPADDYAWTFHPEALLLGDASEPYTSLCLFNSTTEGDLTVDRAIQLDFLSKTRNFRGQIEERHVRIPDFSLPTTDRLGFVEHLLGKIEDLTTTMESKPKIAPFAKHQIIRVKEELTSLSRSIHVTWELQSEDEELKDLLDRMIDVAYQAELAVISSFTIDHPIWYHLSCLSYVLVKIKDIQNEFGMFNTSQIHGIATGTGVDASKPPSVYMPPILEFDEIEVGFVDEEQVLTDQITRGTKGLDIVSIVGMGGLGKTHLAKKLFKGPLIRGHFHVGAFCYVGPEHNTRRILLEILNDCIVIDDDIRAMTKEDLQDRLRRRLKGRRYLIIMDDIWDVSAWKGVEGSFPDDYNGSRIVFTTRTSDVPLQVKSNCTPHYLRPFSIDESWELLQAKVFKKHPCPQNLRKVGLLIAEKCKGLPLAVVVIAGLLAREPESWSSWKRIADDLSSHAAMEGCMHSLELSYKHLPDALKSCLLYFGAFLKKKSISAKRLMLLWDAEGFVPKSTERKNFLSMAKQYLNDLVHRSLVIVHQGSSTGGIKRCGVHDLVRELCRIKAQEEHFFHFIETSNGSNIFSMREVYKQYRLCLHVKLESEDNAEARRGDSTAHTLIYYYPNSPSSVDALPFSNVKLVQVLDVKAECGTFPEEVRMLVNLRYLTLKTRALSSVPSTIAKLWNLETLVLKFFSNQKICLPETIWKMKRLKHVDVGREVVVDLDNDIGKDSSKLPDIESFSSVTITYGESGEELLRRLANIRKLSCYYYTCWDWHRKFEQLPKLDKYLTRLESLNIVSDGAFYPRVPSFPITLKKLSLEGIYLPWSDISAIAELPCLEVLKLMPNSFRGSRWDVEDEEFPKLKFLKLYGLDVAEWNASVYSFPCLEQIVVKSCYNLAEIPDYFAEVATLKVIDVYDCKQGVGESANRIQEEQRELGNILQIRVIKQDEE